MKALHSLQTKLTASFVVLILVVTSLTFLITFGATQQALKEVTQTELLALASTLASQLTGADAAAMARLAPGQEDTPDFVRLRARLKAIQAAHEDIVYVYTMRQTEAGVAFMVDADYGNEEDPGAAVGEAYEDATASLIRGFQAPSVDEDFTTDAWGTFLSGYAPLRDESGAVVGLLGIDMLSDRVIDRQNFIGNTIFAIMTAGILVAGLFILLFSKTIIKDVRRLNHAANKISMGNMDVEVDVHRKDELGELAESFERMVVSLKLMMMMDKEG